MPEPRRRRLSTMQPQEDLSSDPKRPSIFDKLKNKPNWDDDTMDVIDRHEALRLHIPQETVMALRRDGIALMWGTIRVRGQDGAQFYAQLVRGGWTPVHTSDFDGIFDGMFLPKGADADIIVDDAILMCRPVAIDEKARARDKRNADEPLRIKVAELGAGLNIPGGNHPSATRQNRISISREGIEVPRDMNY